MTRLSPLRTAHIELGARLVEFAGWEMPLQFGGILQEHHAVRTAAGVFDVSHLGKLLVEGAGAGEALDRLLPGKVADLEPWSAGYNLVLSDSGGIVDDIFVLRHPGSFFSRSQVGGAQSPSDTYLIVPNAANAGRVFGLLSAALPDGVEVTNLHAEWAMIALSGPRSREILSGEMAQAEVLKFHQFAQTSLWGVPVLLARTGYTGELTFEILVNSRDVRRIWDGLLELGLPLGCLPAGLGARDLLRLEMGYPLHGQDITVDSDPLEAGLDWVVQWDKDFPGKSALEQIRKAGPKRKLAGLIADSRRIPRRGARLMHGGEDVGEVTSGNFSPSLDAGIALGYVRSEFATEGAILEARLAEKSISVTVAAPPFYQKKRRNGGAAVGRRGQTQS